MLSLGIALTETETEADLNTAGTCRLNQSLLHMLITNHTHVETVRLIAVCGALPAQVAMDGNSAFYKAVMARLAGPRLHTARHRRNH